MNQGSPVRKAASRADVSIALLLLGITVLVLVVSAPRIGVTWDEPTYMVASEAYAAWFGELFTEPGQALSEESVTAYWEVQPEHPPFGKVWAGLVWSGARYVFDDLIARRLGNTLLAGTLVALLYLMVAPEFGRTAGLAGAAALLTMPRFFFHAHLIALDVPVALMIFAVTYVFWAGRDDPGLRWTILLGLVWGLGLATKINALFIPPVVLFVWTVVFRPRRYLFARLGLMGLIGTLVFFLSWPWLYHQSFSRLITYLGFLTVDRYPTEQYYFGNLYAAPYTPLPWHYAFVMTAVVVPAALMLLATAGTLLTIRGREHRPLVSLFLLGALASLLVLTSRWGQPFDNERLLMPAFPYVAALAGIGFGAIVPVVQRWARNKQINLQKTSLVTLLAILTFGPHVLLAYDLYPHLLSYYSEAIGGAYGGRVLGLETTYWCESYAQTLSYLNTYASPEAVIWAECQDVLIYYQRRSKLRPDLQIANGPHATSAFPGFSLNPATFAEADYAVIQQRQSGHYRAIREWMHAREPVYEYGYRRLRLAEVFKQDGLR